MINWNDIKHFAPTDLDLSKFDIRDVELPKLPIELPTIDVPRLELPHLPEFDLPADADRIIGFARDAAYAGVGVVVTGIQQAEERRRDLTGEITAQVRKLVDAVAA